MPQSFVPTSGAAVWVGVEPSAAASGTGETPRVGPESGPGSEGRA